MLDTLSYRIPNQQVVKLTGSFIELDNTMNFEGFIISDFEGKKKFGFKVGDANLSPLPIAYLHKVTTRKNYLEKVTDLISQLENGIAEKVVFSRIKKVEACKTTPNEAFERLVNLYPSTFCYFIDSHILGEWVGATPEKLIVIDQGEGSTVSLAGTKKNDDQTSWGNKEIVEQQIVTDYISDLLGRFATNIKQQNCVELVAGPVKHLCTSFTFDFNQNRLFDFLDDYHPTPAVCGLPKREALLLINKLEEHDRLFYTGFIGVCSVEKTTLYVNLRCCQFVNNDCYLFVGGGLTKNSVPENEWEETENKALTILNVLEFE